MPVKSSASTPSETGNPVAAALSSFAAFARRHPVPLIPWFSRRLGGDRRLGDRRAPRSRHGRTRVGELHGAVVPADPTRQVTWAVVACSATFAIGTWLGGVV